MKNKILKNIFNLVILFLSTELLKNILSGIPDLAIIDIRIIFILIIANYLGMKYGIASAILASISYVVQEYFKVNDISVIFLNTNNWIPIAIYILFSIVIGLKTDKNNAKLANLENKKEKKNDKEAETNSKIELYEKEIKELNQMLIVHDSSYIQVSKFIEKLKKNYDDIKKTNSLLKKTLKNSTCELITLEELNNKSNNYFNDEIIKIVEKEKIFINKELKKSLPFYMAPVIKKEKFALVVWKCDFEQMNVEYRNQIIGIAEIIKQLI